MYFLPFLDFLKLIVIMRSATYFDSELEFLLAYTDLMTPLKSLDYDISVGDTRPFVKRHDTRSSQTSDTNMTLWHII